MSTTPWLLKGASGKLGNIVLSNGANGGTARMHVEHIRQPRTASQMAQRARFATVIKFFKAANQNFFKFAFEDKKQKESDYNAFVRHNLRAAQIFTYEQTQNPYFPAIGNKYLMTQGSLGATLCTIENDRVILAIKGMTGSESTWGEVCQKIIAAYPAVQAGDFLTCVGVRSYVSRIDEEGDQPVIWDIHQLPINPDSESDIPDLISVAADKLKYETITTEDDACGGCITISRKVSGGAKVTTSYLELNQDAADLFTQAEDDSYRQMALASWKASGDAILQGSISDQ